MGVINKMGAYCGRFFEFDAAEDEGCDEDETNAAPDKSYSEKCEPNTRLNNCKDAVLCIGCCRYVLIFGYLGLFTMVTCYMDETWSYRVKVMLIIIIFPELVVAVLLFYGVLSDYSVEELRSRKKVLADLTICISVSKLMFAAYYVGLYFLVKYYADEPPWYTILHILIIVAIPITVICGIIMFYGALQEKPWALEVAIWMSLAIAAYNTVLGIIGLLYFLRAGKLAIHFIIAGFFGLLTMSLFAVLCHDVVIIYTLKKTISSAPNGQNNHNNAMNER